MHKNLEQLLKQHNRAYELFSESNYTIIKENPEVYNDFIEATGLLMSEQFFSLAPKECQMTRLMVQDVTQKKDEPEITVLFFTCRCSLNLSFYAAVTDMFFKIWHIHNDFHTLPRRAKITIELFGGETGTMAAFTSDGNLLKRQPEAEDFIEATSRQIPLDSSWSVKKLELFAALVDHAQQCNHSDETLEPEIGYWIILRTENLEQNQDVDLKDCESILSTL